jgi:hypothetical protein
MIWHVFEGRWSVIALLMNMTEIGMKSHPSE